MGEAAKIRATILGCGSSGGVPRPGGADGFGDWGNCDPENPKNRRTRCSLLFERAHPVHGFDPHHVTTALIDTSPDMREQLLQAGCTHLDGVLFTHAHADQSHGIDDLRVMAIANRKRISVWIDDDTAGELPERFRYCFEQRKNSPYPAILDRHIIPMDGRPAIIDGPAGPLEITPFVQFHGSVNSLGFRCGDIAYSSDVADLPAASFDQLRDLDIWIVDALQEKAHGSHAHLDLTLEWIAKMQPRQGVLTNLHVTMDYEAVRAKVPPGIMPAYDGMRFVSELKR